MQLSLPHLQIQSDFESLALVRTSLDPQSTFLLGKIFSWFDPVDNYSRNSKVERACVDFLNFINHIVPEQLPE